MSSVTHREAGSEISFPPSDFRPKEQSERLIKDNGFGSMHVIGAAGCLGQRFTLGPLAIDRYRGTDIEPTPVPWSGLRIILWQPLSQLSRPRWHRLPPYLSTSHQTGYSQVSREYWQAWSSHAQRHRRRWQRDTVHVITPGSYEDFAQAYQTSSHLDAFLRHAFLRVVRFHLTKHPELVDILLARDVTTQTILAGLVTVNYPDVGHSRHTLSFISSEARHTSLGYGLIDTWYQRALSQGIAWLDFGLVWKPGDPSEWRGYSRFKRQFHLHLHRAPRSLIRLSWR